jgi:DNA-binding MarR family transcriptional regulator
MPASDQSRSPGPTNGSGVSIELSREQMLVVLRTYASNGGRERMENSGRAALLRSAGRSNTDVNGSELSRTLWRALRVWAAFPVDGEARGIGEITRELGMPKTTVHRYVGALEAVGLVEPDRTTRRYRISRNLRG